jgi:hypothetical protein
MPVNIGQRRALSKVPFKTPKRQNAPRRSEFIDLKIITFVSRSGAHLNLSLSPCEGSRNKMSSEGTPLLLSEPSIKHEAVYTRFSKPRKRVLVALVSWCGLIPRMSGVFFWQNRNYILIKLTKVFVSGTFIPSIPQIAKDLNSTGPVIRYGREHFVLSCNTNTDYSLAVSLSIFAACLGGLSGASYSTFCEQDSRNW